MKLRKVVQPQNEYSKMHPLSSQMFVAIIIPCMKSVFFNVLNLVTLLPSKKTSKNLKGNLSPLFHFQQSDPEKYYLELSQAALCSINFSTKIFLIHCMSSSLPIFLKNRGMTYIHHHRDSGIHMDLLEEFFLEL